MRLSPSTAAIATAVLLGLAGCGGGNEEEAGATGPSIKTIEISETEFKLDPSTVKIDEPGVYTFRAVNHGSADHALEIEGEGAEAKTGNIEPGESAMVKVELKKGAYELYCPVGNHRSAGMEGSVSVGGAAADGGMTTDEDEQDDEGGYSY